MERKIFQAAAIFMLLAALMVFLTVKLSGQLNPMTGVVNVCDVNPEACSGTSASIRYTEPEPLKCTDGEITYGHDWKPSAWVIWDDWWEVPEYYPPTKVTRVEVCARCGFLRFPPESLKGIIEKGR